mmetsp:Transcript_10485/g.7825  ORF Transcript_10485/g.7825 Transcript_10485/m.7825 type:complete len:120 (-) Transcript_10485:78-437(-)
MLSSCTENYIFGTAKNPYGLDRTTGGSTGGDAGLLASRCTMFAIGTDIGGSIRMPASHCGVFGIRFTSQRCTRKNMRGSSQNNFSPFTYICVSPGPLARNFEDLLTVSKVMLNGGPAIN